MNKDKLVVCFITGSHGDWGGASRVLYTNLRLLDRTRIHPILLLPLDGPIVPELQARGLEYLIWGPMTELDSIVGYVKAIWRMIRFLRKNRVDVIHVNRASAWRPAEYLAAKLIGIPVLTHYHTVNDEPSPFMGLNKAAIAVSEFVAKNSGPEDLKKYVIYNPITLARFDAARDIRTALGYTNDHLIVSFVGQIKQNKGVADFIDMARRLPQSNVRFLIAGECRDPKQFPGSYTEAELEAAFEEDPRIRYLGYLARVEDLYQASDIIVVPSLCPEALGLTNIEAGACRKPVVATRVGGIPEVIKDGENGFLVEAGDVEALAAKVALLLDNPDLRHEMGEKGRARVEAEFTTKPVRELEALFEQIATGREKSAPAPGT